MKVDQTLPVEIKLYFSTCNIPRINDFKELSEKLIQTVRYQLRSVGKIKLTATPVSSLPFGDDAHMVVELPKWMRFNCARAVETLRTAIREDQHNAFDYRVSVTKEIKRLKGLNTSLADKLAAVFTNARTKYVEIPMLDYAVLKRLRKAKGTMLCVIDAEAVKSRMLERGQRTEIEGVAFVFELDESGNIIQTIVTLQVDECVEADLEIGGGSCVYQD